MANLPLVPEGHVGQSGKMLQHGQSGKMSGVFKHSVLSKQLTGIHFFDLFCVEDDTRV